MTPRVPCVLLIGLVLFSRVPAEVRAVQLPAGPASFAQLRENPQTYLGATVVLGGEITRWIPAGPGSLLLVLQHPLAANLRPKRLALSSGWFWVEYPEQLGPLSPLAPILTVVGEVVGSGDGYPVIRAQQVFPLALTD
jgi:starvation-inducible outer membrane lipoprotein